MVKHLITLKRDYVLECIDLSGYTNEPNDTKEKLQEFYNIFADEYMQYNTRRYKTVVNLLSNYFQGLPSTFNCAFYYHDIIEIGKSWGLKLSTEKQRETWCEKWFTMLAVEVVKLFDKYEIDYKL